MSSVACVSEMHVLDRDHRGSHRGQLADERLEHRRRRLAGGDHRTEPPADTEADIGERPQRPRRPQPVAGPEQDPRRLSHSSAEATHERALPDARVPRHEDEPALAGLRLRERLFQHGHLGVTLQELNRHRSRDTRHDRHPGMVIPARGGRNHACFRSSPRSLRPVATPPLAIRRARQLPWSHLDGRNRGFESVAPTCVVVSTTAPASCTRHSSCVTHCTRAGSRVFLSSGFYPGNAWE